MKTIEQHNMSNSPEYSVWRGMKSRCTNSNTRMYGRYGGRGISICPQWMDSFTQFYKDMGPRPSPEHSIDRINNDGNYEPSNCRWATVEEQVYNRSTNITVTMPDGEEVSSKEAMEYLGMKKGTLFSRLYRGNNLSKPIMGINKLYTYRDKSLYLGELALCSPVDLSPATILNRINAVWSITDSVETPLDVAPKYFFSGKLMTVKEVSTLTGVHSYNLRHHLRQGLSLDESVDFILHGIIAKPKNAEFTGRGNAKSYLYKDKYYTVKGLSRFTTIPPNVLADRLFEGWSVEDALFKPIKAPVTYPYHGEQLSIPELVKKTGFPRTTIRRMVVDQGMSAEEAIAKLIAR